MSAFRIHLLFLFAFQFAITHSCSAQKSHEKKEHEKKEKNIVLPDQSKIKIYSSIPYQLNKPEKEIQLPEILNEISGLTDIDSAHIACVQDELGKIFIYNFYDKKIVSEYEFDSTGDFEGLTYTGNSMFILRSDGRLTEWEDFNIHTKKENINHHTLTLKTSNNEGLCYDKNENRLLIAAKSKPLNHDDKNERYIYEFQLSKRKLNSTPVYSLNTLTVEAAAKKFNISQNDTTEKGKIKPFNFRPSSLAIHPFTSDIYIISASDKLLLVMNNNAEIVYMEQLDATLFAKAEGITFLSDGTMIITNEAATHVPTMLIYPYQK